MFYLGHAAQRETAEVVGELRATFNALVADLAAHELVGLFGLHEVDVAGVHITGGQRQVKRVFRQHAAGKSLNT